MLKIREAKITPSDLRDGRSQAEVEATFEDGSTAVVLSYDDDELSFSEGEFVGLTRRRWATSSDARTSRT